ncbi:MAG: hypothetical protein D3923_00455 [Candidatus Electrothrix sp. AR3]|nr:hypothetical protein [Candidatus Electrothrix sp. AR3]
MKIMDAEKKNLIKDAVKRLKGYQKREYIAQISLDYFQGNARKTEREMGWGRVCIQKGIKEKETGIRCIDNYKLRGRKRTEDKLPNLSEDIRALADLQAQADPSMKSGSLTYTRITAKAMRKALIDDKGYTEDGLPCEATIGNILNRLGYHSKV